MSDRAVEAAKLVSMYLGKGGKVNPWFTRRMKETPPEVRDMVWKKIRELNLDGSNHDEAPSDAGGKVKEKVILTDQELDFLAEKTFSVVLKHPTETMIGIVNRQMAQLPQDRRRRITGHSIDPIAERMQTRFKALQETQAEADLLRERIAQLEQQVSEQDAKLAQVPSKDCILAALSDEEIIRHFGEKVIKLLTPHEILAQMPEEAIIEQLPSPILMGKAVERAVEMLQGMGGNLLSALSSLKVGETAKPVTKKPAQQPHQYKPIPKVAMIGLLANQFQHVSEKLAGRAQFCYVDKNMRNGDTIPNGCNYVVLWTRHVSHSMQDHAVKKAPPGGLIRHSGGVDTLVKKLDNVLN